MKSPPSHVLLRKTTKESKLWWAGPAGCAGERPGVGRRGSVERRFATFWRETDFARGVEEERDLTESGNELMVDVRVLGAATVDNPSDDDDESSLRTCVFESFGQDIWKVVPEVGGEIRCLQETKENGAPDQDELVGLCA